MDRMVIAVSPKLGVNNLAEFIALAKAQPVPPLLEIRQQRQISKARQIAIGSDLLAMRR
jgi:hypothetical protein